MRHHYACANPCPFISNWSQSKGYNNAEYWQDQSYSGNLWCSLSNEVKVYQSFHCKDFGIKFQLIPRHPVLYQETYLGILILWLTMCNPPSPPPSNHKVLFELRLLLSSFFSKTPFVVFNQKYIYAVLFELPFLLSNWTEAHQYLRTKTWVHYHNRALCTMCKEPQVHKYMCKIFTITISRLKSPRLNRLHVISWKKIPTVQFSKLAARRFACW